MPAPLRSAGFLMPARQGSSLIPIAALSHTSPTTSPSGSLAHSNRATIAHPAHRQRGFRMACDPLPPSGSGFRMGALAAGFALCYEAGGGAEWL